MHRHPKDNAPAPAGPYDDERKLGEGATEELHRQRRDGGLADEPGDMKVDNGKRPFKTSKG